MDTIEFTRRLPVAPEQVWNAWTTPEGIRAFLAPECRVRIEPDGPFEILFNPTESPGRQGSEGMRVLAVDAPRFLSFTWNAPPSMPVIRKQRTWVEIRIRPRSDGCEVRLTNGGYGDGADWETAHAYFVHAWGDIVLPRLETALVEGPIDWTQIE